MQLSYLRITRDALNWRIIQSGRTKHIDVRHHFIREQVQENRIKLTYCPTESMKADIMTKALGTNRFVTLRDLLMKQAMPISFVVVLVCHH